LKWQRGEVTDPPSTFDLDVWQAQYGIGVALTATSTTVPEPATLTVLLFGMLAFVIGRRLAVAHV
jgi:hypothetical protein